MTLQWFLQIIFVIAVVGFIAYHLPKSPMPEGYRTLVLGLLFLGVLYWVIKEVVPVILH
jgi:hypothetical protein